MIHIFKPILSLSLIASLSAFGLKPEASACTDSICASSQEETAGGLRLLIQEVVHDFLDLLNPLDGFPFLAWAMSWSPGSQVSRTVEFLLEKGVHIPESVDGLPFLVWAIQEFRNETAA
jgi:hypothetical protein